MADNRNSNGKRRGGGGEQRDGRRQGEQKRHGATAHRLSSIDAARIAKEYLRELTGRETEQVSGLARTPEGWEMLLEVVELERIPRTTDLLGSYRVTLDPQGDLLGYERIRRYYRCHADESRSSRGG